MNRKEVSLRENIIMSTYLDKLALVTEVHHLQDTLSDTLRYLLSLTKFKKRPDVILALLLRLGL